MAYIPVNLQLMSPAMPLGGMASLPPRSRVAREAMGDNLDGAMKPLLLVGLVYVVYRAWRAA